MGFLGGQLRLRQPRSGHRAGHDAILLAGRDRRRGRATASSISAPGLARPVLRSRGGSAGIGLVLVEIDPALAETGPE